MPVSLCIICGGKIPIPPVPEGLSWTENPLWHKDWQTCETYKREEVTILTIHISTNGALTVETASGFLLTEGVDYKLDFEQPKPDAGSHVVGNPEAKPK